MKRERNTFVVTMGAYHIVDVYELVGISMWNIISEKFDGNYVGLYMMAKLHLEI